MLKEALTKLQTEITSNNKKYVRVVGAYLMDYVRKNPQDAEKIMTEGKTIAGSLKALEAEAKKPENENMLTPDEGYVTALRYFGVNIPEAEPALAPAASFDVSLDDLL